jgi:hypothetical protein
MEWPEMEIPGWGDGKVIHLEEYEIPKKKKRVIRAIQFINSLYYF